MKITKEEWVRYESSNHKKRKRSATLLAIHRYVRPLRRERFKRRPVQYPLDVNARLRAMKATREYEAELETRHEHEKYTKEIRKTLLCAARIARSMGFDVEKSADRKGHVSSYYARRDPFGKPVRISDHNLPVTPQRELMSNVHGGGSPFAGEVIIMKPMSKTRLRRLLVLAEAGRL